MLIECNIHIMMSNYAGQYKSYIHIINTKPNLLYDIMHRDLKP